MIVWHHLKRLAFYGGNTIYKLKPRLLSDYLCSQLKHNSILMVLVSSNFISYFAPF